MRAGVSVERRRAMPFILGGLMFLAFIAVVLTRDQFHTERFYSDALRAYDVSADVFVGGRQLSVRAGTTSLNGVPVTGASSREAVRLAYARTLAERNPLFAFPGTSPSDLAYAVDELQATANQLANLQHDTEHAELIRTALYPIDFLRKAGVAETARLEFIAHTDSENEKGYERAVRKEVDAYLSDLRTFRNAITTVVPDGTPAYIAAGKIVSKTTILAALSTLEAELRATMQIFNTRMQCLRGFVARCNLQDLALPSLKVPESGHIDEKSIARAREIQSLYAAMRDDAQLKVLPLIVLSESACFKDVPSPPIFFVTESTVLSEAPPYVEPVFVGDIRFIRTDEYENVPFYQGLRSHGIDFVFSPPLLHYECTDEARDATAVRSTRMILGASSSSVVYQADAIRTAHANAVSGDPTSIARALAIKYNSTQFDQSIRDITWTEQKNLNSRKQGLNPGLDTVNMFVSRSGFTSLFATHNSSFISGNRALFPASFIPTSEQPYLYDSQISSGAQKLKLRRDMKEYFLLHLRGLLLYK